MKTARATEAIKAGGYLMAEYDAESRGIKYRCIPGGGLTKRQAERIKSELNLRPGPDALFADACPQTWRL